MAFRQTLALGLSAAQAPEANAVVCRARPYRAGCAGSRGAAVMHPLYSYSRVESFAIASGLPENMALKGSRSFSFGFSFTSAPTRSRQKTMFDPQRAVLIEFGDPLLGRNEARA